MTEPEELTTTQAARILDVTRHQVALLFRKGLLTGRKKRTNDPGGWRLFIDRQSVTDRKNRPPRDYKAAFWANVDKAGVCWIWTGDTTAQGYGRFYDGEKQVAAHRLSWEIHFGPIPDGQFVCHHCDNPPCIRPDHLFLGDHSANFRDAARKGRNAAQRRPELHAGERNGNAKLRWKDATEIRRRYAHGASRSRLAREFGVAYSTIDSIIKGRTWRLRQRRLRQ